MHTQHIYVGKKDKGIKDGRIREWRKDKARKEG
jgi:hypothetical protein